MRTLTRKVAFDGEWTSEDAAFVTDLFDSMAAGWTADHDLPDRYAPLVDALARGPVPGPEPDSVCVELGSGTGLGTRHLVGRFGSVVAVDLALDMLRHAPDGTAWRVRADSARLPVADGSVDAVVLVNMLLFPGEVDRVLAPGGVLVWVNTMAEVTPIHLRADEVHDALPGRWDVVHSRAGSGSWAVAARVSVSEPEVAAGELG